MAKIKKIQCIRTRVNGTWIIVKVITDQPGLYGIGSVSDINHPDTVTKAVETIAPILLGREAGHIEDNWQCSEASPTPKAYGSQGSPTPKAYGIYTSGYWRNGSILNTALGGIDMALWDIKGKEAGMPVYQLLGGPCRAAVPCYAHAGGADFTALEDSVRQYMEEGYQVIRCQLGGYGGGGFIEHSQAKLPKNAWTQRYHKTKSPACAEGRQVGERSEHL